MGWRETLVRGVAIGEAEMERERQIARVALKWPPADRIALVRELLAGTGKVVAPRKTMAEAHACMRATGWQLARGCEEPGSDGVLELACAEVEEQFAAMLGDEG